MSKETGIIMSGSHPVDILEGHKTMTRRTWGLKEVNKYPDAWEHFGYDQAGRFSFRWISGDRIVNIRCPYGGLNSRLWVKETLYRNPYFSEAGYVADNSAVMVNGTIGETLKWRWQKDTLSSMFMPRWASRITLEITGLRVERLQEITKADAIAEGANGYQVNRFSYGKDYRVFRAYHREAYPLIDHADIGDIVRFQGPNIGFASFITRNPKATGNLSINAKEAFYYIGSIEPDYILGYGILWDSLNAKRGYGWEKNPWVWVITFRMIKQ